MNGWPGWACDVQVDGREYPPFIWIRGGGATWLMGRLPGMSLAGIVARGLQVNFNVHVSEYPP